MANYVQCVAVRPRNRLLVRLTTSLAPNPMIVQKNTGTTCFLRLANTHFLNNSTTLSDQISSVSSSGLFMCVCASKRSSERLVKAQIAPFGLPHPCVYVCVWQIGSGPCILNRKETGAHVCPNGRDASLHVAHWASHHVAG